MVLPTLQLFLLFGLFMFVNFFSFRFCIVVVVVIFLSFCFVYSLCVESELELFCFVLFCRLFFNDTPTDIGSLFVSSLPFSPVWCTSCVSHIAESFVNSSPEREKIENVKGRQLGRFPERRYTSLTYRSYCTTHCQSTVFTD